MAGTLEGRQVSWKERIDDYMSIRGLFLAVIVAGTMVATIIAVAYAVSTGQVSDEMTRKMRIRSTHSMPGVTVNEKLVGDKFVDDEKEVKKPVYSWTEYTDSLLAKEENAAQPAPTQPAPTQPAPTQPAPAQPAPAQPAPTQPAPAQPAPAQPAPAQPAPAQPASGQKEESTPKDILQTLTHTSLSGSIP